MPTIKASATNQTIINREKKNGEDEEIYLIIINEFLEMMSDR